VGFLSEQLGNPALLEDAGRRVVAYGRAAGPIAPILRSWRDHSRHRAHGDPSPGVQIAETEPRCVWTSVVLKGEIWGRLHVLEADSPLSDLAKLTVSRAAATIALHLMSERGTHLAETAEQMLLTDVIQSAGRFDGREFLDKATGLGVELEGDLVALVVATGEAGASFRHQPDSAGALALLRQALREVRWPAVVGLVEGRAVAVAGSRPTSELRDSAGKLLKRLPPETHIGFSKPTRASLLPQALSEAQAAEQLGPRADEGFVHFYEDLALYRLLAPLAPGPELASFVESELGPLIAHDEQHKSDFVHTLDAYLQSNGSKTTAAQLLHLQRRSIYYRLERIEELLGRSIDSPTQRARLYVALRGNELLETRMRQDIETR
jgi:purine catabolism regulator